MPKAQLNIARSGATAAISVPNYDGQDQVVIRRADAFRPSGGEAFAVVKRMNDGGPENDTGLEADGNYAYQGAFATLTEGNFFLNTLETPLNQLEEAFYAADQDVYGDIVTTAGTNRTL